MQHNNQVVLLAACKSIDAYCKAISWEMQWSCFNNLTQKLEVIKSSIFTPKGEYSVPQAQLIIQAYDSLTYILGEQLCINLNNYTNILEAISPYLAINKSEPLSLSAIRYFKTLSNVCKPWQCQLASHFLSMCTISHAEVITVKSKKSINLNANLSLQAYCSCLQLCLESIYGTQLYSPLDISVASFTAVKNMILEGYHLEEDELSKKPLPLKNYISAGWSILEGLLGIGTDWIAYNLNGILNLLKNTFENMNDLQIDESKLGDTQYTECLKSCFTFKYQSLRCMRKLIEKAGSILSKQTLLLLMGYIKNCTLMALPISGEKVIVFYKQNIGLVYNEMLSQILITLKYLPTALYHDLFLILLPYISSIIDNSHTISTYYAKYNYEDTSTGNKIKQLTNRKD